MVAVCSLYVDGRVIEQLCCSELPEDGESSTELICRLVCGSMMGLDDISVFPCRLLCLRRVQRWGSTNSGQMGQAEVFRGPRVSQRQSQ